MSGRFKGAAAERAAPGGAAPGGAAPSALCAFALAAAFALVPGPASAVGDAGFLLGGSVEAEPITAWAGSSGSLSGPTWGSATSLDLELSLPGVPGPLRASGGASLEASVLAGSAAGAARAAAKAGLIPADTLFAPALSEIPSGDEALATARIRTIWAKLDAGWASLCAGRQVLSYGRGALWSPVDVFSSQEAGLLSNTRRGVDSLRLRLPLGETGLVDAVAAPSAAPAEGRYLLRASGLVAPGLDAGLLGARDGGSRSWLAGADAKLDLGRGPSLYGEALLSVPESAPASGARGSWRAAAGADWSAGELGFAAEYYWNGGVAASCDPYLAGAHNLYASISWQALDLAAIAAYAVWDVTDATGKAVLSGTWQAAQNADLSLFAAAAGSTGSGASLSAIQAGADLKLKF